MIKRAFFLGTILALTLFLGCKKKAEIKLLGTWHLIEVSVDGLTGNGIYVPVASSKIIKMYDNGYYAANGNLCYMTTEIDENNSGVYSEGIIHAGDCFQNNPLTYEINGNEMILHYPCYEACSHKYIKL
ncbi:MAG: hypothetical protein ACI837_002975 [Crocinitomicaceae bacterium]|jgi:hypothetical protein